MNNMKFYKVAANGNVKVAVVRVRQGKGVVLTATGAPTRWQAMKDMAAKGFYQRRPA